MNKIIVVATAAALLCGTAPASAQTAGSSASGAGMLCSDLTAMDPGAQTAFLQGYWAGHQDAMSNAGAFDSTAASPAPESSVESGGAIDSAGTGSAMDGTEGELTTDGAATDATGADNVTEGTAGTDSMAAGSASATAGGVTDFSQILTDCDSSPTSTISSMMGGMSMGTGTTQ